MTYCDVQKGLQEAGLIVSTASCCRFANLVLVLLHSSRLGELQLRLCNTTSGPLQLWLKVL